MDAIDWKTHGHRPDAGPLSGLHVIELSHVLAGPICGLLLADMGAEVIKVERPPQGDGQRWDSAAEDSVGPYSSSFGLLNRNKRSLVLDLKQEPDRATLLRLLVGADVLVHNYSAGVLDRFGFGYATLKDRFPALVYCSISGFGRSGPWSERGGYDLAVQAMSGIMSFTGPEEGGEPVKCGPPVTDIATGILSATGILAALNRRHLTGQGDHVDTSLLEAGVMFTFLQSAVSLASGVLPRPLGSAHPLYAPYEVFPAADGWVALGTASEATWRKLVEMLGQPELAEDPRFATTAARVQNRLALKAALSVGFRKRPRDAWVEDLTAAGIPSGPLLTVPEMHLHPQVQARDMIVEVEHPAFGAYRAIGCPLKFEAAGRVPPKPAPLLDEH